MVSRWYPAPHRFCCVTNDSEGLDPEVVVIPDRADFASIPSPHGGANPSCYRRIRIFSPDAAATFGERFVSIDLDCVITGDLRPLWDRHEDLVGWSDPLRPEQHCGSMTLLRAGSRPQVWERFDPVRSPQEALAAGKLGSDQGWVSHCLPGEAQWNQADGVYSYRWDLKGGPLPANARIVFFTGPVKPWDALGIPWIAEAWAK